MSRHILSVATRPWFTLGVVIVVALAPLVRVVKWLSHWYARRRIRALMAGAVPETWQPTQWRVTDVLGDAGFADGNTHHYIVSSDGPHGERAAYWSSDGMQWGGSAAMSRLVEQGRILKQAPIRGYDHGGIEGCALTALSILWVLAAVVVFKLW